MALRKRLPSETSGSKTVIVRIIRVNLLEFLILVDHLHAMFVG